jgi:hypothetical protein
VAAQAEAAAGVLDDEVDEVDEADEAGFGSLFVADESEELFASEAPDVEESAFAVSLPESVPEPERLSVR